MSTEANAKALYKSQPSAETEKYSELPTLNFLLQYIKQTLIR